MENASNALIMAGAVLIAVIIISVFLLVVGLVREYNATSSSEKLAAQVEAYNRFFVYSKYYNESTIKGFDAYNIICKALDMNQELDDEFQITIKVNGSTITSEPTAYKDNISWLEEDHSYSYELNENTGRVAVINIS